MVNCILVRLAWVVGSNNAETTCCSLLPERGSGILFTELSSVISVAVDNEKLALVGAPSATTVKPFKEVPLI
ncbi:hypothetical protein SDC9_165782 [bioreactor metagenome]|uniref:Uncharacterized protein n=1 Tax=bioreactor metagenome TaxID=1076179 RepID=A0A645FXI5_9ZZZZ